MLETPGDEPRERQRDPNCCSKVAGDGEIVQDAAMLALASLPGHYLPLAFALIPLLFLSASALGVQPRLLAFGKGFRP